MSKFSHRVDWDGPNLYEDFFFEGRHVLRGWVGGENEEYDGEIWETPKPVTRDFVEDQVGPEKLAEALAGTGVVRSDL